MANLKIHKKKSAKKSAYKEKLIKLITHSDTFHADEIIATAFLLIKYKNVEIIRTRDMKIIETGDIVYDVGFICDPSKNRFDHHMQWFNETYNEKYKIKLSSAGLIFKYKGKEILNEKYKLNELSNELQSFIMDKIYKDIFLPADSIDNGYETETSLRTRSIQDVVANFNSCNTINSKTQYKQFMKALEWVKVDLYNYLDYTFNTYIKGYDEIRKNINECDEDIYIARNEYNRELIHAIIYELKKESIKFIIYNRSNSYRIYGVIREGCTFALRCPLKEEWRGLRGEELRDVSKMTDIVFVHATGFTGESETLEGALEMCKQSIQ